MGDLDGLDVLRELKGSATTADIPVIVLSITQDDGAAWQLGAVDYLTKPVDSGDLLYSVEQALTWQGCVLIVEDDPDTIGLFSATMRKIGFTPLVAANGGSASAGDGWIRVVDPLEARRGDADHSHHRGISPCVQRGTGTESAHRPGGIQLPPKALLH